MWLWQTLQGAAPISSRMVGSATARKIWLPKVRDINEVIVEAVRDGRLPSFPVTDLEVGIQDPCHLEHGQRAHTTVDGVIEAAGFKAIPIDRGGMCCGAAGVYQLEHKQMSDELGQAKADRVAKTGNQDDRLSQRRMRNATPTIPRRRLFDSTSGGVVREADFGFWITDYGIGRTANLRPKSER